MKKGIISLSVIFATMCLFASVGCSYADSAEPVVKIEIPSSVDTMDVTFEQEPSATSKAINATKKATNKTVEATKKATNKTVAGTKKFTKKTVDGTKRLTDKTVDGTKELIDNLNPNRTVTVEELQQDAEIKTLKNEKKGIVSAYNSRIKDTDAKIKATQKSTRLTETERQDQVYKLSKQKKELETQKRAYELQYDDKIKAKQQRNK